MGNGPSRATTPPSALRLKSAKIQSNPVNIHKQSIKFRNQSISISMDSTTDSLIEAWLEPVCLGLDKEAEPFAVESATFTCRPVSKAKGLGVQVSLDCIGEHTEFSRLVVSVSTIDHQPFARQVTVFQGSRVTRQVLWLNGKRWEFYDLFGETDSDFPSGEDCVVCMNEKRNTAVLPCRHLCLCKSCAAVIQKSPIMQQKCPICREMAGRLVAMS